MPLVHLLVLFLAYPVGPMTTAHDESISQDRRVGDFHSLSIAGPFVVDVRPGDRCQVRVEGDTKSVPLVETRVEDGTLAVALQGDFDRPIKLKVEITLPVLSRLKLEGKTQATIGDFRLRTCHIGAWGQSRLGGSAEVETLIIEGAGDCHLALTGFTVKVVELKLSGNAALRLGRVDAIEGVVVGNVNVVYQGAPSRVRVRTVGRAAVVPE